MRLRPQHTCNTHDRHAAMSGEEPNSPFPISIQKSREPGLSGSFLKMPPAGHWGAGHSMLLYTHQACPHLPQSHSHDIIHIQIRVPFFCPHILTPAPTSSCTQRPCEQCTQRPCEERRDSSLCTARCCLARSVTCKHGGDARTADHTQLQAAAQHSPATTELLLGWQLSSC